MKNSAIKIVRLVVRYALAHIAEHDARHFFQQSGIAKMKKHTVPLIRFCADVFKKKNTGTLNLRCIRRAKRLREDGDTPPLQLTFRMAWPENTKAVVNAERPGPVALQGVPPACKIH